MSFAIDQKTNLGVDPDVSANLAEYIAWELGTFKVSGATPQ